MNIKLLPQEKTGDSKFDSPIYMTNGFQTAFTTKAALVVNAAITEIQRLVNSKEGADYFQSFIADHIKFWVIDDGDHITFLLPEEY